jgi:hypothetical protein
VDFIRSLGITTFACNGIIYSGKSADSEIGIPENELRPILDKIIDQINKYIWFRIVVGVFAVSCSGASASSPFLHRVPEAVHPSRR